MASMLMANRKARPNEGKGLQSIAKEAASVGRLTESQLVLAIDPRDRPVEFSPFRIDHEQRSTLFRENFRSIALRTTVVNHINLNFKHGAGNAAEILDEIGGEILPPVEANAQNATPQI